MFDTLQHLACHCHRETPTRLAALTSTGSVDWQTMAHAVDLWRDQFEKLPERHVLIRQTSGDALLACLLACWQCGKTAVLTTGSVDLFAEAVAAQGEQQDYAMGVDVPCDGEELPALVLFTSGSSGTPAAIAKTFVQLDAELAILESLWGTQLGDSVFVAMVSRNHMFGLPFGLLWPAVRGSPFYSETVHYSETLETLAQRFAMTLIASPVQLANLPDNLDWPCLQAQTRLIFSAGAPLADSAARHCQTALTPVTEIYGSTETGAVAWRRQLDDPAWQCLPSVTVQVEPDSQQLLINGPSIAADRDFWLPLADRARLLASPQHFELLGRTDRIVKVAGKRISLTEVEGRLKAHPWIIDIQVVQLPERKGRLGGVVVLDGEGRTALIDRGRKQVNLLLAQSLNGVIEPAAIPRYWRYVHRLPQNGQGKTPNTLLRSLFDSQAQPRLPEVLETVSQRQENLESVRLLLRIPDNLHYFIGHFPGHGVLPGVVQINWAQHFANQYFGEAGIFQRLESLKFQNIIKPGDIVVLELDWQAALGRLKFSYTSATKTHANGRIIFRRGEDGDKHGS